MPKNNKLGCSFATQIKLADSLKELMESEPFEKISISDITNNSGLHRQTFYYHFEDKYELLDWVVYQEIINPLINNFELDDIYNRFFNMFTVMSENKRFYINALKINIDELSKYISKVAYEQLFKIIQELQKKNDIKNVRDEDDILLAEFLGYGIVGIVYGWVQRGMKDSPEVMSKRIENVVSSCKQMIIDNI